MKTTMEHLERGVPKILLPSAPNCWRETLEITIIHPRGADYKQVVLSYMGIPHAPVRVDRNATLSTFLAPILAVINLEGN